MRWRAGRSLARLTVPVAAWMHFVRARARDGIAIVDPLAAQLSLLGRQATGDADHDLPLFFALPGVFPPELAQRPTLHARARPDIRPDRRARRSRQRRRPRGGSGTVVTAPPQARTDAATARVGRFRWAICALLFAATALNYVDRQIIGILQPTAGAAIPLERDRLRQHRVLRSSSPMRSAIIVFGRLIDRIGARAGYAIAVGDLDGGARRARLGELADRLHGGTLRNRARGIGQLPGGAQRRRRMVPEARARVRDGDPQRRHQHRRRSSRRSSCRPSR